LPLEGEADADLLIALAEHLGPAADKVEDSNEPFHRSNEPGEGRNELGETSNEPVGLAIEKVDRSNERVGTSPEPLERGNERVEASTCSLESPTCSLGSSTRSVSMLEHVGQALGGEDAFAPLHQSPRIGRSNPCAGLLVQSAKLHGEEAEEKLAMALLQALFQSFLAPLLQDLLVPLFDGFEQHGSELLQVDQLRDVLFALAGEKNAPDPHDKSSPQATFVRTWSISMRRYHSLGT
jgi:hypothetical protein